MGKSDSLTHFEQLVLLALLRLGSNAYGMTIRQEIESRTGKTVAIGSVYAATERLERRGFIKSRQGEPTPERGGRAKRYFSVRAPGTRALNDSLDATAQMASGVIAIPAPGVS